MKAVLTALCLLSCSACADVLDRAIAVVERAVRVPDHRYRIVRKFIDGKGGVYGRYVGGTIYLDTSDAFDDVSVIAHEIACHDPRLSLGHDPRGRLTNPRYTFVRFPNQFDTPGWNRTYRAPGIVAYVHE